MASLKFRHYATENTLKGTGTIQNALNAFDVGTIIFIDDTQKQYIITSKSNNVVTYKIYYGEAAVVGISGSGATRTLTFSDGSEITVKINDVEHATSADTANTAKSVAWANIINKPNLVTTDTEQTITGSKVFNNNTIFKNETDVESLTADSLLVTGSARFTNTINGNLKGNVEGNLTGNASTATTAATATEFSANKAVTLTGDITGSASSKGGWSIATTIANGAVTNAKLANSKITIAGTAVSLGGSIAASTIGAALTTSAPAAYATNAGSATNAANDGSGNTITSTYATKTERAKNDITAASLTTSKLTLTRTAGNIEVNIPTWNQNTTGTAAKATADANGNNIVNTYATKAEVAALPKSMVIKGTLDATHALPTSGMTEGDTYIVGTSGTYNKIACKVGDFFIRTSNSWLRIPAGDEWEYNENTIKGIKVNNAGHADTADTAVSAGMATNADKLGNLNADNYFKQRDAVFNSEWDGKYLWTLWDNHLYAADKRFAVTLTGTDATNFSYLFDGSFESMVSITETKAVLHIKHTTAGNVWTSGLPYGSFYVVFYNSDAENVTGRVYCNYDGQGIGWHDLTATHVRPHVWELDNDYYQLSDLEITITKPASSASIQLCQVLHEVERSAEPNLAAVMSKYCNQKTDYSIEAAKFIGPLQGNATTASSCSGNSATATKAGYLDTGTMTLYAHGGNEINFGGTARSDTIYFGYRAIESKPIPTSFIFGGSTGTATLTAGGFKKKDSDASYVLTGDGGHAKISGLSVNYATSSGSCSGNSATATKLQTARTIWGQSFDGSRNVSGSLTGVTNIAASGSVFSNNYRASGNTAVAAFIFNKGGDYFGIGVSSGSVSNVGFGTTSNTTGTWKSEMMTITNLGNVGIGTTSPTSKLHVAGTGYFSGDTSSAANIIAGGYIKGETVKISSGCTLEYSSTDKCIRFVFN